MEKKQENVYTDPDESRVQFIGNDKSSPRAMMTLPSQRGANDDKLESQMSRMRNEFQNRLMALEKKFDRQVPPRRVTIAMAAVLLLTMVLAIIALSLAISNHVRTTAARSNDDDSMVKVTRPPANTESQVQPSTAEEQINELRAEIRRMAQALNQTNVQLEKEAADRRVILQQKIEKLAEDVESLRTQVAHKENMENNTTTSSKALKLKPTSWAITAAAAMTLACLCATDFRRQY